MASGDPGMKSNKRAATATGAILKRRMGFHSVASFSILRRDSANSASRANDRGTASVVGPGENKVRGCETQRKVVRTGHRCSLSLGGKLTSRGRSRDHERVLFPS